MADNNMRIWEQVCVTDPSHTKPVSFGRKFTAIDATYQIQQATRIWGPIGEGWGFEAEHSTEHMGNISLAISDVTLWWREGDQHHVVGTVRGSNALLSAKGHLDEDAWKKATTDALTKALAYCGFNADVFLGKFDDNRYVQQRRREESSKTQEDQAPPDYMPADYQAPQPPAKISEKQKSRLEARIHESGSDRAALKAYIMQEWGVEHLKDLDREQYEVIDKMIDAKIAKAAAA